VYCQNQCIVSIIPGISASIVIAPRVSRTGTMAVGVHWGPSIRLSSSTGMAEVVNLRVARKRAARDKAAQIAAEHRLAHGRSKTERSLSEADRDKANQTLDQHRIETGDRR